jgi:hypothetical protein
MALSPKASCSIHWVSVAVFLKIETKLDTDSLLLKLHHISCKKIAISVKHNLTKALNSQLDNCWYTDSQSILLATSSGGRAYGNQFGLAV